MSTLSAYFYFFHFVKKFRKIFHWKSKPTRLGVVAHVIEQNSDKKSV